MVTECPVYRQGPAEEDAAGNRRVETLVEDEARVLGAKYFDDQVEELEAHRGRLSPAELVPAGTRFVWGPVERMARRAVDDGEAQTIVRPRFELEDDVAEGVRLIPELPTRSVLSEGPAPENVAGHGQAAGVLIGRDAMQVGHQLVVRVEQDDPPDELDRQELAKLVRSAQQPVSVTVQGCIVALSPALGLLVVRRRVFHRVLPVLLADHFV
mmetsp:Transcript_24968/g.56449  ORF Transcript_24968/g.56449 Transcript_24968/m.56449 type:complete len:212 (+) Transcript_24968:372-1007(+)